MAYSPMNKASTLTEDQQSALDSFFETFADSELKDEVGPHLTYLEADAMAKLFSAFNYAEDASEWIRAHQNERGKDHG